ncbi:hypothetical protein FP2506_09256 [Fulvimarina pelagi HTCC2506]|uniref:Uncharacterized protein n=1 Tax=Fulvimarina pelagi HTCC2506 TaxID=314231 RepID=Q0G5P5_9HYPH|nr:hypothetical protein FP2506_09256 [Fulvimarina pelagi HTCC2506]
MSRFERASSSQRDLESFVIPDLIRDPFLFDFDIFGGAIATCVREDGPQVWIPDQARDDEEAGGGATSLFSSRMRGLRNGSRVKPGMTRREWGFRRDPHQGGRRRFDVAIFVRKDGPQEWIPARGPG